MNTILRVVMISCIFMSIAVALFIQLRYFRYGRRLPTGLFALVNFIYGMTFSISLANVLISLIHILT